MRPIAVFLFVDIVHRRRSGIAEMDMRWRRAKWIARDSGVVVYQGKLCGARDAAVAEGEATRLAHAWLAKQNTRPRMSQNVLAAMEWTGPRFVDTTRNGSEGGHV